MRSFSGGSLRGSLAIDREDSLEWICVWTKQKLLSSEQSPVADYLVVHPLFASRCPHDEDILMMGPILASTKNQMT